jgi:hypothetical protein
MGYIREPDGIDFIISGKPLTNSEKQNVSNFIKADKAMSKSTKQIVCEPRTKKEQYRVSQAVQ